MRLNAVRYKPDREKGLAIWAGYQQVRRKKTYEP